MLAQHHRINGSGSVQVSVLQCMIGHLKNGYSWHCQTRRKIRSYYPYLPRMRGSGLAVRRVFGNTQSPISRCGMLPMVFRIRTLMCCFLQAKMKNRRFGQAHTEGSQNMTRPVGVGSRYPLMSNCRRRMSPHLPSKMVYSGSAHHRVWEVTRSLPILGILFQMCRITFATSCVMQMAHFGWRQIRGLLNMTRTVEKWCYINPVQYGNRSLKHWSQTSNLMGITFGSIVGGLHRTVRL